MNENSVVFELDASVLAPGAARDRMAQWLATVDCTEELRQDTAVVVSELVTNAVTHAHSAATVRAAFDNGCLRVEVCDDADEAPQVRASGGVGGGFGLHLVASLADRWGWRPTGRGKVVWAETRCRPL